MPAGCLPLVSVVKCLGADLAGPSAQPELPRSFQLWRALGFELDFPLVGAVHPFGATVLTESPGTMFPLDGLCTRDLAKASIACPGQPRRALGWSNPC